jgi:hypothetical protein
MPITYIDFVPSNVNAPEFQVTLDEQIYNVIVTWNLYAQRYYINLYTLDGILVVSKAMVGSPIGSNIENVQWTPGSITVETQQPHGLALYATVIVTISGMVPEAYNGTYEAFVTSRDTISYAASSDPGAMVTPGTLSQNINLVAGYFNASSLVYRQANNQFEIESP